MSEYFIYHITKFFRQDNAISPVVVFKYSQNALKLQKAQCSKELLAYPLSLYKRQTVLYTFSLWNVHQINLTVWSGSGPVSLHGETAQNLKLSVLVRL